jgi:hypothetical protein
MQCVPPRPGIVTLSYVNGLRLGAEDWSSGTDITYTYDGVGNRRTRLEGGITLTSTYNPGFRLYQVTGAGTENYTFDSGGEITNMVRGGVTRTNSWTACGRLKTATRAGTTTTYGYDPTGRRISTAGPTPRRFVVGPTAGTDLEVTHLVTDASGNIKALYVYYGDQPLMRFTINPTSGTSENPVCFADAPPSRVVLVHRRCQEEAPAFSAGAVCRQRAK